MARRALVLVHGLWNTPQLFNPLMNKLRDYNGPIFIPYLPHECGRVSIKELAFHLDCFLRDQLEASRPIDLIGFSMGGLIARVWIQTLGGFSRTKRFISIGTPHKGTLTSQLVPLKIFRGIAEMKLGSSFLVDLNRDLSTFQRINCLSFYSRWDLMVYPGWEAVLPIGLNQELPTFTHRGLISSPKALRKLKLAIINDLNLDQSI